LRQTRAGAERLLGDIYHAQDIVKAGLLTP